MQNNYEPSPDRESQVPRVAHASDFFAILSRNTELYNEGASDDDVLANTNHMLVEMGQVPLIEGETQRAVILEIDGVPVETVIDVRPDDIGTHIRTQSELVEDGFIQPEVTTGHETMLETETELGDTALGAVGIENPVTSIGVAELLDQLAAERQADTPTEEDEPEDEFEDSSEIEGPSSVDALLADPSWEQIGKQTNQLSSRTRNIVETLDDLGTILSAIYREGGNAQEFTSQIIQKVEALRSHVGSGTVESSLFERTRLIGIKAEETINDIQRSESTSEEERHKARLADEPIREISYAARIVSDEYKVLRTMLAPNGPFNEKIQEVMRSARGYEFTISLLRKQLSEASDETNRSLGQLSRIEAGLADIDRIRRS